MPRLILLNGPPGIGKSTIAQRYVDDHPLVLNLDLDVIRSLLGRWGSQPEDSGTLTRAMGVEMARTHLGSGHDVIVPQLLARLPFINALEQLAADAGVAFHELVLMAPREDAVRRFRDRTQERRRRGEPDPQGSAIEREGGVAALEATYERLTKLLETRPRAVTVTARSGRIDETYAELLRCVSAPV